MNSVSMLDVEIMGKPKYTIDRPLGYPPCTVACPIHTDAQGYVNLIAQGRFADALDLIRETNPLAYSLGIVCPHPCESKCRRAQVDEPVAICSLKRSAAEHGWHDAPAPAPVLHEERIAIIGAGPAGLTAAHDLLRLGYRVTAFDKLNAAGGTLYSGVPVYRLPKDLLQKDADYLRSLGLEIKTGVEIGKDLKFDDLFAQGYSAVIIGVGLTVSRNLNIPNIDAKGVLLALPFLYETNFTHRYPDIEGKTVVVIGGGSVATDVARSAVRSGAKKVKLACLEARHEMPAQPWEVEECLEEGIEINCSRGPKSVVVKGGQITGLEVMEVKAVFDAQGRFNPTFYEDRVSVIEGDRIIVAIGQGADLSFLKDSGVELNQRGQIVIDPSTWATTRAGVFACGDVAKGPGPAVAAMANARLVAASVHLYLRQGQLVALPSPVFQEVPPLEEKTIANIPKAERAVLPTVPPEKRMHNFDIVDAGFSQKVAIGESQRCLNCASGAVRLVQTCVACLTCVRVCPFGVPRTDKYGKIEVNTEQCQACGLCARDCPGLAINLRREVNIRDLFETLLADAPLGGPDPVILALGCHYCSSGDNGVAAPVAVGYPPNVLYAKLLCLGKLDLRDLLAAFELGADGVLMASCAEDRCHFVGGCTRAKGRAKRIKDLLDQIGLGADRLYIEEDESAPGIPQATSIDKLTARLRELGPNPSRKSAVRSTA